MARRVALRGRQILIDGTPCFLRSGEMHYFRMARADWAARIAAARDGGLNCLASYIPWQWHEPEEGAFDFTGDRVAERNLGAFLDLVKKQGLWFFARIGPYVNAELARGGHPLWLYERHPEVKSKEASGGFARCDIEGGFVPSQLDPRYLELVFRWYERVIEVLAPYSIDNGGSIILMQVDNEPNLTFSFGVPGSLYDPHVIGGGGLWERWLAGARGGQAADPPRTGKAASVEEYRLALDWLRFKKWHVFEYIRRLADRVRALGLDLPFTMNEPINRYWGWNSGDHASFVAFMKEAGTPTFTNGHCYLHYGGEQNVNGAPVTLARIESVKMSGAEGPPSIYELGSWYTVPSGAVGSCNWDIMTKLLIGSGMNGYSVYVYNDGRVAPGFGKIGGSYDWNTALGHEGRRNRPFEVLRGINAFVDCWQAEILGSAKLFDVTIGLCDDLPLIARNIEPPPSLPGLSLPFAEATAAVNASVIDLCRVLTHLSVNFELASLDHPNRQPGAETRLLIVPNNGTLSAKGVSFVESHLAAGGDVLFYPLVPTMDFDGKPLARLAELAGQRITGSLARGGRVAGDLIYRMIDGAREREVGIDSSVVHFDPPAGAAVLARHGAAPVAYRVPAGGGSIAVLGLVPAFFTEATQRLFAEAIVEGCGVQRVARAADGSVFVAARGSSGGPTLLAAATILGEDASTTLGLRLGADEVTVPVTGNLEMKAKEARLLWVNLQLPEAKLLCTTSQITRGGSRGEYLAAGAPGTAGQVAFDRKLRARVAGAARSLERKGGAWILSYEHVKGPLSIALEA